MPKRDDSRKHTGVIGSLALACTLTLLPAVVRAQTPGEECLPPCRSGFVCVRGQCVSACNPPCAAGQECVNADCVAATTAAPPPAGQPAPAAQAPAPAPAPAAAPQPPPPGAWPAQQPQGVAYPPPPADAGTAASPPSGVGVRAHDGFYVRLGLGVGGGSFAGRLKSSDVALDGAGIDGKGVTVPVELALGGTLAPGFVLGVGIFGASIPAPSSRVKNYGVTLESDGGSMLVSTLGPFVDYYFDPLQGLHLQAGIAYAVAAAAKSQDTGVRIPDRDFSGSGWSAMLGLGWETWIGDQWSAGVLGRVQYGGAVLDATSGSGSVDVNFLFPAVLASFTYH